MYGVNNSYHSGVHKQRTERSGLPSKSNRPRFKRNGIERAS